MVESDESVCMMCHEAMPRETGERRPITGNVCDECIEHYETRAGVPLSEFLDMLDVPVLLSDDDGQVQLANKPLLRLVGKKALSEDAAARRLGNVFECAYARLPEGCGRTVHCSGCAIRRAVTETFTTGRGLRNVPAYLNRDMVTQFQQLGIRISTEKTWGMVLLRVDHVGPPQESAAPRQAH